MIPIVLPLLLNGLLGAPSGSGAVRPCKGTLANVIADTTIEPEQIKVDKAPSSSPLIAFALATGPAYPTALRDARQEGLVRVTFVVDTSGRVLMNTAEIVRETDREFGRSVCEFLARARFTMGVIDGRKRTVRVVEQPFAFSLSR